MMTHNQGEAIISGSTAKEMPKGIQDLKHHFCWGHYTCIHTEVLEPKTLLKDISYVRLYSQVLCTQLHQLYICLCIYKHAYLQFHNMTPLLLFLLRVPIFIAYHQNNGTRSWSSKPPYYLLWTNGYSRGHPLFQQQTSQCTAHSQHGTYPLCPSAWYDVAISPSQMLGAVYVIGGLQWIPYRITFITKSIAFSRVT